MKHKMSAIIRIVAVLIVALIITASPTFAAKQCPITDAAISQAGGYTNAVEAIVKSAPDCERAFKVLDACQLGSSGDVALSEIVRGKCEPLFIGKAGPGALKAYKKKQAGCARIAKKEGTMYLGLAAVCEARVARNFARKYAKGH
jgi:hypothetical protein